jgi:hypothetical protein
MTERKPLTFDIPPGAPVSSCSGCNADILWIVTRAGKRMPVNGDGTSHFATCPKAALFRKK